MAEYIDRQAFNDAIREAVRRYPNTFYNGLEVARQIAHDMDAADVAPVRHGRWIDNKVAFYLGCSECGCYLEYAVDTFLDNGEHYHYCPNCGASMEASE